MKKYIVKYKIEEEIEASSEFDALIIHQDSLAEKLGSMVKEIVIEKNNVKANQDSNGKNIPTNFDLEESLECVWNALSGYRKGCISGDDEQWDDVCTAMAWIEESLNEDENDTLASENKNFAEYLENVLGYDLDLVSQVANGNLKQYKKIQIPIGEEDIRMFQDLVDDGEPFNWSFDKIDVEFIKDDGEDI